MLVARDSSQKELAFFKSTSRVLLTKQPKHSTLMTTHDSSHLNETRRSCPSPTASNFTQLTTRARHSFSDMHEFIDKVFRDSLASKKLHPNSTSPPSKQREETAIVEANNPPVYVEAEEEELLFTSGLGAEDSLAATA